MFVFIPNNIFYNSILGTELIFTAILLAATNLYMGSMKFKYILIGILAGLNTMIKPFFIIFFFLIFLVDIIKNRKLLSSIKNSLIVLLFTAIVISPWIYRNSKLMGEFTYVSNNGGIVLYINNNSQNDKGRWMPAEDVENSIVKTKAYKNANMTEKNKMLSAEAKKWIKAHPMEFIDLGFKRLFNTYFVGDDVGYSIYGSNISYNLQKNIIKITNLIRRVIFGIGIISILVYSIVILMLIIKGKTDILNRFNVYSVILFFMFTCVYFITEGQGRYSFPIIFVFVYWFYNVLKYIYFLKLQFTNTD
jgi:4-amino-4-deoxy-L-arabinose transferase-like glycosyltransferase